MAEPITTLPRNSKGQILDEDGAILAEEALRELRKFVMLHERVIAIGLAQQSRAHERWDLLRRTFVAVTHRNPRY